MTQEFSDAIVDCIDPSLTIDWPSIFAAFGLPHFNIALFKLPLAGLDFILPCSIK